MLSVGFDVRIPGLASDTESLLKVVTEGEQMGYDYTTFSDHLVSPTSITAKYPYKADGKMTAIAAGERHDLLAAIAFFAAKTATLRFVTSVMVVPYRPPVLTAKMLATIDVLSEGRLTVGVGTGWMEDEFLALQAPEFAKRGKVTDEYLSVMRTLWTDDTPVFAGEYVAIKDVHFEPKPKQKPHPPLWVGGLSAPALRRVAAFGDAWYPVPTDQSLPMDSLPRVREGIAKMRAVVEKAGRDPSTVAVAMRVHQYGDELPDTAGDGEKRLFSGKSSDLTRDLAQLEGLGVSSIDFRFTCPSADRALKDMADFQSDVVSNL